MSQHFGRVVTPPFEHQQTADVIINRNERYIDFPVLWICPVLAE